MDDKLERAMSLLCLSAYGIVIDYSCCFTAKNATCIKVISVNFSFIYITKYYLKKLTICKISHFSGIARLFFGCNEYNCEM